MPLAETSRGPERRDAQDRTAGSQRKPPAIGRPTSSLGVSSSRSPGPFSNVLIGAILSAALAL